MRRELYILGAISSGAVAVAAAVAWAMSEHRGCTIGGAVGPNVYIGVDMARGSVGAIYASPWPQALGWRMRFHSPTSRPLDYAQHTFFGFGCDPPNHSLGFSFGRIVVPMWLPLAGAVAGTAWIGRAARRQTTPEGICPRCGYDLRATPERCPECGAVGVTERPI